MRRGTNVGLTREIPTLTAVVLGIKLSSGEPVLQDNLVVATLLCDSSGQLVSDRHFVFFNQLTSPEMSVAQLEQALGADTEQVEIDLLAVPSDVQRIVVVAYINEGIAPRRKLGQLREATVRVLNLADNSELVRSENLASHLTNETGLSLGELYRHEGGWKFKVVGQGYSGGIAAIAADHGLAL